MIEIKRGAVFQNEDEQHYCVIQAIRDQVQLDFVCSEELDGRWALLVPIGKPGKLARLRVDEDIDECEEWVSWIAEQVLEERRHLSDVFREVRGRHTLH